MLKIARDAKQIKQLKRKQQRLLATVQDVVGWARNRENKVDDIKKMAKKAGLAPVLGRSGTLLTPAQLRIAFSGASQKHEAKTSGVAKSTVAYLRKAVAESYLEAQGGFALQNLASVVCTT